MCLQKKAGEHIPDFLILQHVLGGDGAQLLPGTDSSLSPANPPLELS